MSVSPGTATGSELPLREQLSNLHSLLVLSMMMTESRDESEILELALTSAPSLARCAVAGLYLAEEGKIHPFRAGAVDRDAPLIAQLEELDGAEGPVAVPDAGWAWAFPLRSLAGHSGYLVTSSGAPASAEERFILKVLAQHCGMALANARLHQRERAIAGELAVSVTDLERTMRIHEVLTEVAASGAGEEGVARAVNELTGLAVAVEDPFGNLRCWAGPDEPHPYPKPDRRRRSEVIRQAQKQHRPIRDRDRVIALAQPRHEVLGCLVLMDPDEVVGEPELLALEHGATVLAAELAHLRGLAEAELRLRRDLVEDLLAGTDEESAFARADALGYDLHRAQHVAVIRDPAHSHGEVLYESVRRSVSDFDIDCLLGRHAGGVVLVVHGQPRWAEFHKALSHAVATKSCVIGIGGRCDRPRDFPRSHRQAALAVKLTRPSDRGVTSFGELGVYRILSTGDNNEEIEGFIREWLGPLLDYDTRHKSDLVETLTQYLDCGGNYDATAEALSIHRSTLRYRLQRIRDISHVDMNDADSRFNLQLATRAWCIWR
jgi:sugar diacid utilization regulator